MDAPEWSYDTAKDLDKSVVERLRGFPREPDMWVYGLRSLAALLIRGFLKLYHRIEVSGRENLPPEGSFILVANHTSHLDALSLASILPLNKLHRTFPAAAADYFFTSVSRVAFSAIVINALPFKRQAQAQQSLGLCRKLLETPGNVLVIFPEGTRSATGELGEFKPGIGLLAAASPAPVLPCYISGGHKCWPRDKWLPRPGKLKIVIGKPRSYASYTLDKPSVLGLCQDLRQAVVDLRGGSN